MPPLPATFDDATKALIDALERRQKDIRDFQIPRLRQCKGPLSLQQQYAAEIREDIDVFAKQVESLDVAVDDQHSEKNRRELRSIVDAYRESLASMKKESRAALLASKRAIDATGASNREELLRSSAVREKQDLNEKVAEDALMTVSNNVTEALQRTMALMQGELEKSVLSTQLLDQSTAALKSTSSTHDVLDSLLTSSKHLITALEKSDWIDRMLVLAGLVFFILVVLFILKQRLVDRGLRIAFWWTRFIPTGSKHANQAAEKVIDALEKGSLTSGPLADAVTAVTSALTTASTVMASVVASSSLASPSYLETSSSTLLSTTPSSSLDSASLAEAASPTPATEAVDTKPAPKVEEEPAALLPSDTLIDVDMHVPIPTAHDEL